MFDSVKFVRDLCKEKNIPISTFEKECGFSNGYLNPVKLKKIPYDRAVIMAERLGITAQEILEGPAEKEKPHVPQDIGPNKQAVLDLIDDLDESEAALLLERIKKIKESRV